MERALSLLMYVAVSVLTWLRLLFLRFNALAFLPRTPPRRSRHSHALLVLGDGIAAGLGDYTVMGANPGPAGRIGELVSHGVARQQWAFISSGAAYSTSADWLPGSGAQWAAHCSPERLAMFDVVLLAVGSHDDDAGIAPEQTAKNIEEICRHLREHIAHISVAGLSPRIHLESSAERNALLQSFLKKNAGWLHRGPDLDHHAFQKDHLYSFDARHFNSAGHKLLAKEWVDLGVDNMVRKVEWGVWQQDLVPGDGDKSKRE